MLTKQIIELLGEEGNELSDKLDALLDKHIQYPFLLKVKEAEEALYIIKETQSRGVYLQIEHLYNNCLTVAIAEKELELAKYGK